jgi:hypothetical protein
MASCRQCQTSALAFEGDMLALFFDSVALAISDVPGDDLERVTNIAMGNDLGRPI